MPPINEIFAAADALTPDDALNLILRSGLDDDGLMRVASLGTDQAWLYRHDPQLTRRAGDCRALAWAALSVLVLGIEREPKPPAEMGHEAARRVLPFPERGRLVQAA